MYSVITPDIIVTRTFGIIPKQVEESVFALAENPIFDFEKTAPISNSGLVFSESNLRTLASASVQLSIVTGIDSESD